MRSKAPLVMMEQLVMVLVFALTAALCVQVFVLSEKLSVKTSATDKASMMAQNVAERIKNDNPKEFLKASDAVPVGQGIWVMYFNETWNVSGEESATYYMEIQMEEETVYLWQIRIMVFTKDGMELFSIPVASQKTQEG